MLDKKQMGETSNTTLSSGVAGNYQTCDIMKRVARERSRHPFVRQLALRILNAHKVQSHDYINEALAIGRFVKAKVKYVKDIAGVEQLHDPLTMIDQIVKGIAAGDCDDMSLLIATLLLSIGHEPFFRCVRYRNTNGAFNHIYVVEYARNPGKPPRRIVLDAILKDKPIGFEVPQKSGEEIKV